jgi:hypothetical protein
VTTQHVGRPRLTIGSFPWHGGDVYIHASSAQLFLWEYAGDHMVSPACGSWWSWSRRRVAR